MPGKKHAVTDYFQILFGYSGKNSYVCKRIRPTKHIPPKTLRRYAVAELAICFMIYMSRNQLTPGTGCELKGKTLGIQAYGNVGRLVASHAKGFGMKVLAYDPYPAKDPDVQYTDLDTLLREADVVSLYCPLTKENRHMINAATIDAMKDTAFLINTSRGALIDSEALVEALKEKKLGGAALDVYEEEAGIFYTDQSSEGIEDDTLARLISMPNAIITSHQGYLTEEALSAISGTTLANVKEFEEGKTLTNQVK